jgi:hypothetical protein
MSETQAVAVPLAPSRETGPALGFDKAKKPLLV